MSPRLASIIAIKSSRMESNVMDIIFQRLTQRGSPFELETVCIDGEQRKRYRNGPKTLIDIYRKANDFQDRAMLVCNGAFLSYGTILTRSRRLADFLSKKHLAGVATRVGIALENGPEWIQSLVAVTAIGATAVLIDRSTEPSDIALRCVVAHCWLLLADQGLAKSLNAIGAELEVIVIDRDLPVSAWSTDSDKSANAMSTDDGERALNVPQPDDIAIIEFTSESTGRAKGVMLSHENLITSLLNMMLAGSRSSAQERKRPERLQRSRATVMASTLVLAPLAHIGGYAQILLAFYTAGKLVLLPKWDAREAYQLIAEERVRSIAGASPNMLLELARMDCDERDRSSLASIFINGLALTDPLIESVIAAFPSVNIGTGYGMTETCGSICSISHHMLANRPGASGVVLPSVDVRIVDPSGADVPAGEDGEILIRGAMVMHGYCGPTSGTTQPLHNGWLKTSDCGHVDADGYLYLTHRLKDIIRSGDRAIVSSELERMIGKWPAVGEVAACGIPDKLLGERVSIGVVLRPGELLDVDDIRNKVRMLPICRGLEPTVSILGELPRTPTGKINASALRQILSKPLDTGRKGDAR
jgi:long-chain acyl-CoA synthetase